MKKIKNEIDEHLGTRFVGETATMSAMKVYESVENVNN